MIDNRVSGITKADAVHRAGIEAELVKAHLHLQRFGMGKFESARFRG